MRKNKKKGPEIFQKTDFKIHFFPLALYVFVIVLFSGVFLLASDEGKKWNWEYKDKNGFNCINFAISAFAKNNGKWDVVWANSFEHSFPEKMKECNVSIVLRDKTFYLKMGWVKECPMGNLNGMDTDSLIFADTGSAGIETPKGHVIVYRPLEKNKVALKTEEMDFYVVASINQGSQKKIAPKK